MRLIVLAALLALIKAIVPPILSEDRPYHAFHDYDAEEKGKPQPADSFQHGRTGAQLQWLARRVAHRTPGLHALASRWIPFLRLRPDNNEKALMPHPSSSLIPAGPRSDEDTGVSPLQHNNTSANPDYHPEGHGRDANSTRPSPGWFSRHAQIAQGAKVWVVSLGLGWSGALAAYIAAGLCSRDKRARRRASMQGHSLEGAPSAVDTEM